jgi:MoaA/NifB/PqqE/SkfB family radical SAM enzyme
VLVFGLDGIGETHDCYRGLPGAFDTLMRALEMTRDLPKEIIVTLWTGVISQIDAIIRLAEQYNALVHFNGLIPVGRVRQNRDIIPDASALDKLYERLYALKMSGGSVITDLHKVTARDRRQGIDLFCRGRYNITPEGNVRPCEFHYAVLGNIDEQPLGEIIERAQATDLIRSREQGFKDCIPEHLDDPFDYHTQICHRLAGNR